MFFSFLRRVDSLADLLVVAAGGKCLAWDLGLLGRQNAVLDPSRGAETCLIGGGCISRTE